MVERVALYTHTARDWLVGWLVLYVRCVACGVSGGFSPRRYSALYLSYSAPYDLVTPASNRTSVSLLNLARSAKCKSVNVNKYNGEQFQQDKFTEQHR
ncbi:hypothetical protein E2C01_004544 [Portunus trituberculatus]|uniref:Uncharacterized protein n=1 Tax=Portunus trituberculatus TaxID=210409 RepID=A0A5B7CQT3_PORTR|nr:hypothetical protein [Portunus trituberculatus]